MTRASENGGVTFTAKEVEELREILHYLTDVLPRNCAKILKRLGKKSTKDVSSGSPLCVCGHRGDAHSGACYATPCECKGFSKTAGGTTRKAPKPKKCSECGGSGNAPDPWEPHAYVDCPRGCKSK